MLLDFAHYDQIDLRNGVSHPVSRVDPFIVLIYFARVFGTIEPHPSPVPTLMVREDTSRIRREWKTTVEHPNHNKVSIPKVQVTISRASNQSMTAVQTSHRRTLMTSPIYDVT